MKYIYLISIVGILSILYTIRIVQSIHTETQLLILHKIDFLLGEENTYILDTLDISPFPFSVSSVLFPSDKTSSPEEKE